MKILKSNIVLYDAECDICNLYANTCASACLSSQKSFMSYQQLPADVHPALDRKRAANEIAIINAKTGEVKYGGDGLLAMFSQSFPRLKSLFSCLPFVWLIRKVYAFIAYNRRIIILTSPASQIGSQPGFSLRHRLLYLFFTWLAVGYILTNYAVHLNGIVPIGHTYREFLICGGQILFQAFVINFYAPKQRWDYLGNMMSISFAGALLLLPILLLAKFISLSAMACTFCFMAVAGLMLLEHIKRSRLLGIGWLLTATWIIYRLIVLLLIF